MAFIVLPFVAVSSHVMGDLFFPVCSCHTHRRERKKDLQESSSKLRRKSQELIEQYDLDMDIADRY